MTQTSDLAQTDRYSRIASMDEAPGMVTTAKVISAVEQIVAKAKPLRVVAFGSRARGNHRPDSDLDLAVIVEKYDPSVDKRPIWRSDVDSWMSIDMLVVGRERYEYMRGSIISVYNDVANEGITLYDASTGRIDHRAAERVAR